ncbi:MAG TPA: phosphodiester glycosidase family protein [Candidatus Acidoferrales bacterium]|nr:phosphodiester glycosidase family protein [Candidatus Acidoferrales bacterium]
MRAAALARATAFLATGFLLAYAPIAIDARRAPPISAGTTTIEGHVVRYVIARLDRVRVRAALGGPNVGDTAWLADIAKHDHAIAAINGGYFECYNKKAPRKNLDQTTVVDGSLVFKGDVGSVLYFDRDNHATIMRIPLRIDGSLDGSDVYPNNWYAYWINRLPGPSEETITIFTPAWGRTTGLHGGPQIQVTGGAVSQINYGPTVIPRDGYVIYFRGEPRVAFHFWVGRRVSYTITAEDGSGIGDFAKAWQAIGGGPQLLVEGMEFADPRAEGFKDPKIFRAGTRSMVGISEDQSELIFAVADGTLDEDAHIMKTLGAYDAMNLDGGASSGLWANGKYLVSPGRRINNALVLTR